MAKVSGLLGPATNVLTTEFPRFEPELPVKLIVFQSSLPALLTITLPSSSRSPAAVGGIDAQIATAKRRPPATPPKAKRKRFGLKHRFKLILVPIIVFLLVVCAHVYEVGGPNCKTVLE